MKTKIYNLIILDESGSMDGVRKSTISGCNETINTIRAAQKKYLENQEHYVSVFAFQSEGNLPSRYLFKNVPVDAVSLITAEDYQPYGMTPLYDALGSTLSDLKHQTAKCERAIGSVTIITDGLENSSVHYDLHQVSKMISGLKELGWNFNFIGANIDVDGTAASLNIDNCLEFEQNEAGVNNMFECERNARMSYFSRVQACCDASEPSGSHFAKRMKEASKDYFKKDKK